ncbi:MAG: hypothetical protein JJT94_13380 [Bernardetiaceae bacterium]|nr:hypothetical protein [Bernardetiaceae bacterium]
MQKLYYNLSLALVACLCLVACGGSTTTTTEPIDSTNDSSLISPADAVAETDNTTLNPAFESLLTHFESCENLERFFKADPCTKLKEYENEEAKQKLKAIAETMRELGIDNKPLRYLDTESFLSETLNHYVDRMVVSDMYRTEWNDLIFISFGTKEAVPAIEHMYVLVFNNQGEFQSAFTNYNLSRGTGVESTLEVEAVEATDTQIKILMHATEDILREEEFSETKGDFYLINAKGEVSYDNSQKQNL